MLHCCTSLFLPMELLNLNDKVRLEKTNYICFHDKFLKYLNVSNKICYKYFNILIVIIFQETLRPTPCIVFKGSLLSRNCLTEIWFDTEMVISREDIDMTTGIKCEVGSPVLDLLHLLP